VNEHETVLSIAINPSHFSTDLAVDGGGAVTNLFFWGVQRCGAALQRLFWLFWVCSGVGRRCSGQFAGFGRAAVCGGVAAGSLLILGVQRCVAALQRAVC